MKRRKTSTSTTEKRGQQQREGKGEEEKKKKKRKKSDGRETLSEIGPFRIPNFEEEDALALLLVPLILRLTSPIEEAFRGRRETREGKSI